MTQEKQNRWIYFSERRLMISKRLFMLANLLTPGLSLADVGCDHGFLSIFALQQKIAPCALALDVRKGPLKAAKEHIALAQLSDKIETRLSDGLEKVAPGQVQAIVCAGMGGRLMQEILRKNFAVTVSVKELILQPQSEIADFRRFLYENAFTVLEERALLEDGKFYFAMKVKPPVPERPESFNPPFTREDPLFATYMAFGQDLLQKRDETLYLFLQDQRRILSQVQETLLKDPGEKAKLRSEEVKEQLALVESGLSFWQI